MGGRITAIGLVLATLTTGVARGQGLHAHENSDPWATPDARSGRVMQQAGPPPGMPMYGPSTYGPPPPGASSPAFPPGMYDPTAVVPAGGMMPAGPMAPPPGMMPPPGGMPPGMPQGPAGYCPPGSEPWVAASGCDDPGEDSGIKAILAAHFAGAYFRTDFLLYEFEDPGTRVLGESSAAIPDVTQPFTVFSQGANPVPIGIATVPSTTDIFFKDQYGARLTYGRPAVGGTLEISAFVTEETDEQRVLLPLPPNQALNNPFGLPVLLGNTTFVNGDISSNIQLYDRSYTLNYSSRLWGAGGRLILPGTDNGLMSLRGTVGWRYFSVQESLIQRGQFSLTDQGMLGPIQNSLLQADVYNNVMGVELGFQAELHWWKFAFGVEPAVTLGPNYYQTRTTTDQFVSTTDPYRSVTENDFAFSPVLELGAYAKFELRERVELRIGYDAMWFTQIQRPAEAIVYDIDDSNNTSLVRPQDNISEMLVDGLNASVIIYLN